MAYCRAALSPSWSGWFKQATMRVWPAHESLAETVIVPGNNKIRLLDHRNRCTHGLLKSGFSQDRFDNEISARQLAGGLGLPIPDLLQHDQVAGWFTESYVVGTPLNRLADQERAINVADRAFASLDLLIDETVQTTTVGDYVASLCDRIRSDLNQIDLLPDEMRRGVEGCVQRLTAALADSSDVALETAQTHGDFQPANILVADLKTQDARTDAQFWIIDWEYAGRRQRDYDWLVFHAHARRGSGLASRLRRIVGQAPSWRTASSGKQIALPQFASTIFLLEELELRLGENKNPRFTRVDGGLPTLLDEIQNWFDQA